MVNEVHLLPVAASICLLVALVQAWLMTGVRYFDLAWVKRMFPNYRNLIRSHVDYLMMTSLIFSMYLVLNYLELVLPTVIYWLIFIGAIYNPFGFLIEAIKPDIVDGGGPMMKLGTVLAFMPLTIGLFWAGVEVVYLAAQKI